MTRKRHHFRRKLLKIMDLPIETEGNICKLTMVGRSDLLIENHTGIFQYANQSIKLHTQDGMLCITGNDLALMELGMERAYVRGRINGCVFEAGS